MRRLAFHVHLLTAITALASLLCVAAQPDETLTMHASAARIADAWFDALDRATP